MNQIIECVPNYSEGCDTGIIEKLIAPFRRRTGVQLLDYKGDADHNRTVVTVVGEPEPLGAAVVESVGLAVSLINMTKHRGQHPRMGCVDVIPFIPIRGCDIEDADCLAKAVAKTAAEQFGQPFFLYAESASAPHRKNLSDIRRGQFEGMAEKMKDPLWRPDFGPGTIHPTGGVTAIGARMPLVAFNVNLDTQNLEIANQIAERMRFIGGGYRFVKAMGVKLEKRNIVQVSMNLTDYTKTAIYRVFETVKMEAHRYGVNVLSSEIVGLLPMRALIESAEYYLQIENFSIDQVLETRLE